MSNATGGNVKATREDWLRQALEVLVATGVTQVRVLTLSRELGVSRSSFYWYFENRQHLLDELVAHWRATNTAAIVAHATRPAPSITAAVLNLFECFIDTETFSPQLDFAVREWARRSPDLRVTVERSDAARVDAIREMFVRHGYDAQEAFIRARVLYFMQVGYYALEVQEPFERRLGFARDYLLSFTGREPAADELAACLGRMRDRHGPKD